MVSESPTNAKEKAFAEADKGYGMVLERITYLRMATERIFIGIIYDYS